jgi:endonuclease/exonuclease/phosphatase family metal-dependent hydrolase
MIEGRYYIIEGVKHKDGFDMKVGGVNLTVIAAASITLIIALLLLAWRNHKINYTDPHGDLIQENHAGLENAFDGSLRVVTWNLHFGEKLDEIIATLENATELQEPDLLLLQEINAEGVESIARQLRYNYIYYPTVFSRRRQSEYGIAILSKWPLKDPDKILLPNWLPGWVENRFAVKAVTTMNDRDITVYNTHLDLMWMEPQVKFLASEMDKQDGPIILGGDFNTWRPWSIPFLEDLMKGVGLERLTRESGYTFEVSGLKFTLDHIFSEELDYTSGVYRKTNASDHHPVWVEIKLQY